MSEQNILNPSATSLLNYDWGYSEGLPELRSVWQAQSGKIYSRLQMARGRVYDLTWNNRDLATMHALRQWEEQYRNDFFTLADWERGRYFSGRFEGPLAFNPAGFEKWNIRGRFVELPGLAMYAYPSNWARDAIFYEERDGFGADLVKLAGTWIFSSSPGVFHGDAAGRYYSVTTSDTAEWIFLGYGWRVWANTENDAGIMEMKVTKVRDGSVVANANIDLYSAATQPASALWTGVGIPLDLYRVRLRITGTKNPLSSNYCGFADAVEVLR